jgi:hypothetical protein
MIALASDGAFFSYNKNNVRDEIGELQQSTLFGWETLRG